MLRLTRVRPGERGAIATIVAILFMFGVMFGLAALTIDVGRINADRRQLQNGADAVALAAAKQCAETGVCPLASDTGLQNLANANSATSTNRASQIRRVDGQTPAICGNGGGLPACPSSSVPSLQNLQECPKAPASGVSYVRVYTETKNAGSGQNILPYSFGAAIAGVGSGANQQTCASASWGAPSGIAAPVTLSYCEWAAATGHTTSSTGAGTYAASPAVGGVPGYGAGQTPWPTPAAVAVNNVLPAPVPGHEIIINLQGSASTNCHTWNTHDAPGGFGYVSSATSCTLAAPVGGWTQADTGNVLPAGCPSLLPYFNTVLYLPVFDCTVRVTGSGGAPTSPPLPTDSCIDGGGSNTWYHIEGYAKFYLSGYTTSGAGSSIDKNHGRTNPLANPPEPCTGNDRCLSGWFLEGLVNAPSVPPPPGPPLGAYAISLSG